MATTKPRITITLEPSQYAVLERLSALQKQSMSGIVKDLLAEVTPVLSRVADSLEIALKSGAEVRAQLKQSAEEAEAELAPLAEYALDQLDMFLGAMKGAADEQQADGSASRDAARGTDAEPGALPEDPRPVITGVNPPQEGPIEALQVHH